MSRPLDRRDFLRRSAAAGIGLSVGSLAAFTGSAAGATGSAADAQPQVRRRVQLGRTGLEVSDVGFGANSLSDPSLVHYAIDRGINYFDTAEGYRHGGSEEVLGKALVGHRDEVIVATKAKVDSRDSRDDMMAALETSLRRLGMEHVDVFFNHAVNSVSRIDNPEWPEFTSRAKQQGKIRFSGMSGHGGNLPDVVERAIETRAVDVFLLAHNFGQDPAFYQKLLSNFDFVAVQDRLPALMKRARSEGFGVIAMKTLRGARLNDLRPYEVAGGTYAQAALRWVLAGGHSDSLIISMRSREHVDEYLGASGHAAVSSADISLLRGYEGLNGSTQCRYGCGECSCPEGVAIDEVLRTRMYDRDYGDGELAREDYAKLAGSAEACSGCAHQACLGTCPFDLPISSLTRDAHARLSLWPHVTTEA
jgi:predicted aldo/keto reductase-like oxidoreductase